MTDSRVRLVLDTTAVLAYTEGSINLGETIAEVVDEGNRFAVPVLCLIKAARQVGTASSAGLRLLVGHVACTVLPVLAEDWSAITAAATVVGRVDAATAVIEAAACVGYVVTAAPDLYAGLDDDGTIIPI